MKGVEDFKRAYYFDNNYLEVNRERIAQLKNISTKEGRCEERPKTAWLECKKGESPGFPPKVLWQHRKALFLTLTQHLKVLIYVKQC